MLAYMGAYYRNEFVLTSISLLLITGIKLKGQWLNETIVWTGNQALLHNMESLKGSIILLP